LTKFEAKLVAFPVGCVGWSGRITAKAFVELPLEKENYQCVTSNLLM
jgi:hypothetical protein